MLSALPLLVLTALRSQTGPASISPPAELNPAAPTTVGFGAGLAHRRLPSADDIPPSVGIALTTIIHHRYAGLPPGIDLGVEANFGFCRYARSVDGSKMIRPGEEVGYSGVRTVSQYDFVLLQTAALPVGRFRPWMALGGGISLGRFASPELEYRPGEARETRALAQAALGIDFAVRENTAIGLGLSYLYLARKPTFVTESGRRLRAFGDRTLARVALLYRF